MSYARECDLCGSLFKAGRGVVTIEAIYVATNAKGTAHLWDEIDFCQKCSAKVLAVIGPAMGGLRKAVKR